MSWHPRLTATQVANFGDALGFVIRPKDTVFEFFGARRATILT